jgi:hypothetical protein
MKLTPEQAAKMKDANLGHAPGFQPEEGGSTPTSALQSPTP